MNRTLILLLSAIAIVALSIPRFNRADLLIDGMTTQGKPSAQTLLDAGKYIALTKFFRGDSDAPPLLPPWAYRPLVPFVASILPFDPMTGINLLNLASIVGAMLLLYRLQRKLGVDERYRLIGCLVFGISFPTFFYTSIGYVDPALIFFLTAGACAVVEKKWILSIPLILLGSLAKEGMVILLPVLAVALLLHESSRPKQIGLIAAGTGAWLMVWSLTRALTPVQGEFAWNISFIQLAFNGSRFRSWGTFVLTFGLPGLLLIVGLLRKRQRGTPERLARELLPLIVGIGSALLLYFYAWWTVFVDGRYLWPLYPFAIPVAMWFLQEGGGLQRKPRATGD